jgi:hypothetical protein
LAAALIAAAAAGAKPLAPTAWNTATRHYSWHSMSLTQRIHAQRQLVIDDWRVITTWRSAQAAEFQLPRAAGWETLSTLVVEPAQLSWRNRHMKWTQRELRKSLRQLAKQAKARAAPAGYPPHHRLWVCIAGFEGSPTSVNPNGHYGMLQMTLNWMNVVPGKASAYSELQQEWFAEQAYSEYHTLAAKIGFLDGQWFNYDAADGCVAYA